MSHTQFPVFPDELLETPNQPIVTAFVALEIVGGLGSLAILSTALLSSRVRRSTTWISFCASWIISSVSYLLLSFAGRQTGVEPSFGLCLAQAALVYANPPLTAATTCALVVQLWLSLSTIIFRWNQRRAQMRSIVLIVFPYVVWLAVFVGAFFFGFSNNSAHRNDSDLFCIIGNGEPGQVAGILVAVFVFIMLGFEAHIAVLMLKKWNDVAGSTPSAKPSITMIIRVAVFSICGLVPLIVAFVDVSQLQGNDFTHISMATVPVEAALVFGTQNDILRVWMFWKKPKGIDSLEEIKSKEFSRSSLGGDSTSVV